MNDWLASDPDCFSSATELKFFLDQFGPLSGRYHLSLPKRWTQKIIDHYTVIGDLEKKRAVVLLQRAVERAALYSREVDSWEDDEQWDVNVARFDAENPNLLKAAIVPKLSVNIGSTGKFVPFGELALPPTEEEVILAIPTEYLRVSQILLRTRPELVFIDPYMNPLDDRVFDVLEVMFREIAGGKCQQITMYARQKVIDETGVSCEKVEKRLEALKRRTGLAQPVTYILVDDSKSSDRLHGRYLLSLKGGIRFEQGFQRLSRGRRVEVAPIGQVVLGELVEKYIERKNNLIVKKVIQL